MKKTFFKVVLPILFILCGGITGCDNFFNGELLKESLDSAIEYANASYADITINSLNASTEYISPATGNYNNKYKKTDKFDLSFIPTSKYQFAKWVVSPEESISFTDASALKTTAEVMNINSAIKIEPLVYERATVSVSPENVIENPRNSAILITFSKPLSISDEDLKRIEITIDDISVLGNFNAPTINEARNKITFVPKRDNFIEVTSGVKIVKVHVPGDFYYLKDDSRVFLQDDYVYSFKINSTTETSAEISVSCPASAGDISYSGTKVYYLDNEFSVSVTPNEAYLLKGWSVKFSDGTLVDENILEMVTAEDGRKLKVKVLTGTTKPISITPNLVERGSLIVNFTTANGITVPSEQKKYYVGDTFSISYREVGDFSFTGWESKTSLGLAADSAQTVKTGTENIDGQDVDVYATIEPYISFVNKSDYETQCTVLQGNESITIIATCGERPSITGFSPEALSGVNRDSKITVLFSQSMSESSIYWTEAELNSLGVSASAYDLLKAEGKADSSGKQYYYAYQEKGNPETLKYKNIEIYERSTRKNLLKHYKEPFYESNENMALIIPSAGMANSVPAYTTVEVKISSTFASSELVAVNQKMVKTFGVNAATDSKAPVLRISEISISGTNRSGSVSVSFNGDSTHTIGAATGTLESSNFQEKTPLLWNDQTAYTDTEWKALPSVVNSDPGNHKLRINIKGIIEDGDSKPAYLKVSLVPKRTDLHQVYKVYTQTKSLVSDATGKSDFSSTGFDFEFNLRRTVFEGVYKIQISALDNGNNERFFDKEYGFVYDDGLEPLEAGNSLIFPEGTKFLAGNKKMTYTEIAGQELTSTKTVYSNFVNVTEKDFETVISKDHVTVLKSPKKVAFRFSNLQNCEYCVTRSTTIPSVKEWIPTEQEYDLAEVYKDHDVDWWKPEPNPSDWKKNLYIKVRDVFGNETTSNILFMVYGDAPSLTSKTYTTPDFDIFTMTGKGTVVTFTINESCSKLKCIYSEVKNTNSASYCPITGVEAYRTIYSYTALDETGCNIQLDEPLSPTNGSISLGLLFSNLERTRGTVSMRFKFEDTNGWISDWYEMEY